jgi:hypothetical protein
VVVSAEALGLNEDKVVDFVNPELLLTQNQSRGRAFEMDSNYDAFGVQHSFPQSQSTGFEEFMSQLNSQSERDNSFVFKSAPEAAKEKKIPSLSEIFGQDTKNTRPMVVERVTPIVQEKTNRPLNLFAKTSTSSALQRDKPSDQVPAGTSSQRFGLAAAADLSSDSSMSNNESNWMFLKALAGILGELILLTRINSFFSI